MGHIDQVITTEMPVDELTAVLTDTLFARGVTVVSSFNLRSACAAIDEPCPHHGTTPCACQLVVLILYDWEGTPHGLLIYGVEGECQIKLDTGEGSPKDLLISLIRAAVSSAAAARKHPCRKIVVEEEVG